VISRTDTNEQRAKGEAVSARVSTPFLFALCPLLFALSPLPSRSETLSVFVGGNERLDHLGVDEVAVELIEFVKPEVLSRLYGKV